MTTDSFLERIGGKVQFCYFNKVISKHTALTDKDNDIYFLAGVEKETRGSNKDVTEKNYLCIDLDIRKDSEKDISNEEIKQIGIELGNKLNQLELFNEWSYIVFTGNGLHIYFIGPVLSVSDMITPETYSKGVQRIYRRFYELTGYKPDDACKNIGRILRLPGTVNQKNGAFVEIIANQNKHSGLVAMLNSFGLKEIEEIEQKRKEEAEQIKKKLELKGDDAFYEEINLTIKAYELAQTLLPEFQFDGKKNFLNGKGGLTGYWYCEENNTIVNGGSRYFAWGDDASHWNNFAIIKHWYSLTNLETFEFFKKLIKK